METTFKVTNPDNVEITFTATMTAEYWLIIAKALKEGSFHFAKSEFASRIYSGVLQLHEKVIQVTKEE